MDNHEFCRLLLKVTRRDLTPKQREAIKGSWSYMLSDGHGEWHGPDDFYWHGSADCAYDARAKGISAWLDSEQHRVQ